MLESIFRYSMKILPALLLATAACCVSASAAENKATFVILPDTQTYFEQCPEVLESQIDWIVENHNDIDAVLQVGGHQEKRIVGKTVEQDEIVHLLVGHNEQIVALATTQK